MSERWYFAYGSNLSEDRMRKRTGSAHTPTVAHIRGYRFAFNKRGRDGTAKANIMPDEDAMVWGVAYRCSCEALSALDCFEGVRSGDYVRTSVRIVTVRGRELDAMTYIATPRTIDESLGPSDEYFRIIIEGARQHHLPEEHIREIYRAAGRGWG